jgi:hypothetical protein
MYCSLIAVAPDAAQRWRANPETFDPVGAAGASLEKAWHGLHFLLTGSAWEGEGPLAFLLQGGETIGDEEMGVRLFSPEATRALDRALTEVSDDQLWERFDPERMTEEDVYPGIWDESEDDLREEYLEYFHVLKKFIHRASTANQGFLVSIG